MVGMIAPSTPKVDQLVDHDCMVYVVKRFTEVHSTKVGKSPTLVKSLVDGIKQADQIVRN